MPTKMVAVVRRETRNLRELLPGREIELAPHSDEARPRVSAGLQALSASPAQCRR